MTVQEHYDRLKGELPEGISVNIISQSCIEIDMGDKVAISKIEKEVSDVVNIIKSHGYTITNEPSLTVGYRGAVNEALILEVPIEKIEDY